MTAQPYDLADILAHRYTTPAPKPTVFPAAQQHTAVTDVPPFTLTNEFPTAVDPALLGDYAEVTPETCGIPDDRVAQVVYLRGLADQIELAMTDRERAELAQYYPTGLRGVA